MHTRTGTLIVAVLSSSLLGCAEFSTVYRTADLDSGASIVTDAQQRVITNTEADANEDNPGINVPRRIVCLEPSPDVAQIFSNALSIVAKASDASGASGSAGLSSAVSLGQLVERLATIQLLRDELSHLCRAYANGSVSTTTYTLRLNRLDKKMVTLLMAEMSAGAFGRDLTGLRSASAAIPSSTGTSEEINKAQEAVSASRDELESTRTVYEAAKEAKGEEGAASERKAYNAALDDFNTRNAVLFSLVTKNAASVANAQAASSIGRISGRSEAKRHLIAAEITGLQRNYLDEDDLGILLSACISATDRLFIPKVDESIATNLRTVERNLDAKRTEIAKLKGDISTKSELLRIEKLKLEATNLKRDSKASELEALSEQKVGESDDPELLKVRENRNAKKRAAEEAFSEMRRAEEEVRQLQNKLAIISAAEEETSDDEKNQLERLGRDLEDQIRGASKKRTDFEGLRDEYFEADQRFNDLAEESKREIRRLERTRENLQDDLVELKTNQIASAEAVNELVTDLVKMEGRLETLQREEATLQAQFDRLAPSNDLKLSAFAKWCQRDLPVLREQIRHQHITQAVLREIELRIGQRTASTNLCHAVVLQGDKAPKESREYCKGFFAAGVGNASNDYKSILIDRFSNAVPDATEESLVKVKGTPNN